MQNGYSGALRKLLHYYGGQALIMLAGFISMPILTRLLDKSEYGRLTLAFLAITLLGSFFQLGMVQGMVRFFPEFAKQGSVPLLFSSILRILLLVGGGVFLVGAGVFLMFGGGRGTQWSQLVLLVTGLTVSSGLLTCFLQVYRSEHRSVQYNLGQVMQRYASLIIGIVFVLLVSHSAVGVVLGRLVAEVAIVAVLFMLFLRQGYIRFDCAEWGVGADMVRYGLPLSVGVFSSFLFESGDRYIINALLSPAAVAAYSVPYDLCSQVDTAITNPLRLALVPFVMSVWANEGKLATAELISTAMRYTWQLLLPVGFGFAALAGPIISIMASDKYADSVALVPLILPAVLLGGSTFLPICVFAIQRRTGRLALIVLAIGIFNLLLNLLLLPVYGLYGAALATLITYVTHACVMYSSAYWYLHYALPLRAIGIAGGLSVLMWLLVKSLGAVSSNAGVDVVARASIGAAFYTVGLLVLDGRTRTQVIHWTGVGLRAVRAS